MQPPRLILVTGAPRSGTTVVGELLSTAPRTGELYEPMNAVVGDPAIANQFEIPGSNTFGLVQCEAFVDRVEARQLRPRKASGKLRNPYLNRTNRTIVRDRFSPIRRTTIWKDPFAFFLAPQIVARGNIPVIVTVRDPLSLAGSFKRMNWTAGVGSLATRMDEAGLPIDNDIRDAASMPTGPAASASILWNLCHRALLEWLDQGLNLLPIAATDLIERPVETSARLAEHCGLPIRPPAARPEETPASDAALPGKAHIRNRSAASITDYWKRVLDQDEVAFCRQLNAVLWDRLADAMARGSQQSNG